MPSFSRTSKTLRSPSTNGSSRSWLWSPRGSTYCGTCPGYPRSIKASCGGVVIRQCNRHSRIWPPVWRRAPVWPSSRTARTFSGGRLRTQVRRDLSPAGPPGSRSVDGSRFVTQTLVRCGLQARDNRHHALVGKARTPGQCERTRRDRGRDRPGPQLLVARARPRLRVPGCGCSNPEVEVHRKRTIREAGAETQSTCRCALDLVSKIVGKPQCPVWSRRNRTWVACRILGDRSVGCNTPEGSVPFRAAIYFRKPESAIGAGHDTCESAVGA